MDTIIRASMLPAYHDCSRRAAAKQFRAEIMNAGYELPQSIASVGASVGTAVHAAAAVMLSVKKSGAALASCETYLDVAIESFSEESEQGLVWDDTTPNKSVAIKQIERLTRTYITYVLPTVEPLMIEQSLKADAGDGFTLTGHLDLLETNGTLRDLKTGALVRPYQAQLGAYSLLVRSLDGFQPFVKALCTDFIKRAAYTKPQPEPVTTYYDLKVAETAAHSTIEHIKKNVTDFRGRLCSDGEAPEEAFPANPMSMMCSKQYCPAWGTKFCNLGRKDQ